jgi:hypothetical protein
MCLLIAALDIRRELSYALLALHYLLLLSVGHILPCGILRSIVDSERITIGPGTY